ncbi:MAG: hypothetical protein O3A00_17435 [Planctomycetota bacterium]|nr:hypothetical protein [Planctomycetota bacterium]
MIDLSRQFVLAIDAGAIGTVVMVVIAIISWIANLSSANANKEAPARSPRRRPVQDESDEGERKRLQQARREHAQREQARRMEELTMDDEIVVVSESGRRQPRRRRPPTRQNRAVNQRQPQQQPRPTRPGDSLANRADPLSSNLGVGLQQHVAEYMDEHIRGKAKASGSSVDASVRQHFADRLEASTLGTVEDRGPFGNLLRDPARIREAIILNEILSPPKSLR